MKKNSWRFLTAFLSIALFASLVWGFTASRDNRLANALLENQYQRAYASLMKNTENMSVLAWKTGVVSSPAQSMLLLNQLSSEAMTAEASLAMLPVDHAGFVRISGYLNQVSDYCASCFKALSRGEQLTDEQNEQLLIFAEQMGNIYEELYVLNEEMLDNRWTFAGLHYEKKSGVQAVAAMNAVDTGKTGINASLGRLNDMLSGIDGLTYKGGYSEHMQTLTAKGLTGESVNPMLATEAAAEFFAIMSGSENADTKNFNISEGGVSDDNAVIPAYYYEIKRASDNVYITVSKAGGHVISAVNNREVYEEKITVAEAENIAVRFLEAVEHKSVILVSRHKNNHTVTFTFVFTDEKNVVYYPDEILLKVALDDGEILGFEARGYYMNHIARELNDPVYSLEDATGALRQGIDFSDSRTVLISDGAGGEVLCHEINCHLGENNYTLRINGELGQEEQVMLNYNDESSFYLK